LRSFVIFIAGLSLFFAAGYLDGSRSYGAGAATELIPVSDPGIYWSPYNWYDGDSYRMAVPNGAYMKVAFEGATLGIGVDKDNLGAIPPFSVVVQAYIDGGADPIRKDLSSANGGQLMFTRNLEDGPHTAVIYLSRTDVHIAAHDPDGSSRWNFGAHNALRVTGVVVDEGAGLSPPGDTAPAPAEQKLVLYGDSITEGYGVDEGAEHSWAGVLSRMLGFEYGQIGYGNASWNSFALGQVPPIWMADGTGFWDNYFAGASRMDGGQYLDGTPIAVFNNMGVNDTLAESGADIMRSNITAWIAAQRAATAETTGIYMVVPFKDTGSGDLVTSYKAGFDGGCTDYIAANPSDTKVYLLDLGNISCRISNAAYDSLHPAKEASAQLAGLIYDALTPLAPASVSASAADGPDEIVLAWTAAAPDDNEITHLNDGYIVQYKYSADSDWITYDVVGNGAGDAFSVSIPGLAGGLLYDFRVTTASTGLVDVAPYAEARGVPASDPDFTSEWSAGGDSHTRGSAAGLEYAVRKDIRLLAGVEVDGVPLASPGQYAAYAAGDAGDAGAPGDAGDAGAAEMIIAIGPSYLEALSAGKYTLAVSFSDGLSATGTFRVYANGLTAFLATNIIAVCVASALIACVVIFLALRRHKRFQTKARRPGPLRAQG